MKKGIEVVAAMVADLRGFEQIEMVNKAMAEGYDIFELNAAVEAYKAANK